MGIPGFNTWFAEKYAKTYVPMDKVRVDHLYIDLNSVLHTVLRNSRNHNHFHKLLHKRLSSILDITEPTKSVMIAVDGPAPLAKLLTQRDRRKKNGRDVDEGETLTGVAITPGTTFMLDLTHSLTYFCCTKLSSKRFRHLMFELSDGTVKGEGEVKVLGRLARPWLAGDATDTHVILGDDADLILMALTSYKENLFVANSSLNQGRLDKRLMVFSVNLLHQAWASGFLSKVIAAGQVPLESALLHAKLDLTLIAILAKGNDYLPGLRGAAMDGAQHGSLWPVYKAAAAQVADTSSSGSGSGSPASSTLPSGAISAGGSLTSIDPSTGKPRLDVAALAKLLQLTGAGADSSRLGQVEWRGSKAAANTRCYLRGCVWLLEMYLTGQCPDYRFVYDGVAPTDAAVRAACEALVASGQMYITSDTFGAADPQASLPLLPAACALALLPANCRHLAAPCVRHLMELPLGDGAATAATAAVEHCKLPRFDPDLYYNLYGDCSRCKELGRVTARAQQEYMTARQVHAIATSRLQAVQRGTAPVGEAPESELAEEVEAADRKMQAAKSAMQRCEQERKTHISSAHPYSRFPVERLESVAAAALAIGPISPEERAVTKFGRPVVLRAFNSKPEAAAFIRTQTAAAARQQPQPSSHRPPHGQPPLTPHQRHQQQRGAASWQQPRNEDYDAIFVPPPPPFKVESRAFFAAIVRQEVLHDDYGSAMPMHLRVAPTAPREVVRYLTEELEVQPPDPARPQARGSPRREVNVMAAAAAAAATTGAAEAVGVAVAAVATASAATTAIVEAIAVVESHKRTRAVASPQPQPPTTAEAVDAESEAEADEEAVSVLTNDRVVQREPAVKRRGLKPKPSAAASLGAAGVEASSGCARSSGGDAQPGAPARSGRGRRKGSDETMSKADTYGTAGAAAAAAAAATAAVSHSAASGGPGPSGRDNATASRTAPSTAATAVLGAPPPMPSSRLLRIASASAAGGGGGHVHLARLEAASVPAPVPELNAQPYSPPHFAAPVALYGNGCGQPVPLGYDTHCGGGPVSYGITPPPQAPAPYSGGHSQQPQYYTARVAQQFATGHPYNVQGGLVHTVPYAAPVPMACSNGAYGNSGYGNGPSLTYRPASTQPAPYRPMSPTSASAASAAAAAAVASRNRVAAGSPAFRRN